MEKEYPYQKEWEKYRFYARLWWAMYPIGAVLAGLLTLGRHYLPIVLIISLLVVFWLIFIFINVKLFYLICPNCKKYFFSSGININLFQTRCSNCGKEKFYGSSFERIGKRFGF